ncbi:ras-domain-containing protein [Punctularia strigosozonata HHB-11173 SS5]|uniref:ras-domain-containing protein n=1 Tax=Punctularia strigosozonata (strain HHB-11173) TaxID=741275 RepID=UPI00044185D3|nr:ras-domain-containing protein [Punctularia strigosozonata HHB-11173 SS5]EIN11259.1 ras-domain-containing protein [Punctularia strigosozonata HHB-11173 SS5]
MTWEPSSRFVPSSHTHRFVVERLSRSAQETGVQLCSIVLLGAGGVGKTAIVCQLITYTQLYDPTIEDTYIKVTTVDSVPCTVEVVDTAGQSEYMPITEQWIKLGQAFILVYDITSRASFEQLRIFRGYMLKHRRSLPSCMLVGNKCERALQREVPTEEGQEMAQSFGCPFVEVSAKTAWGVPTLFENFVRILRLKPVDERSSTSRRLSRSFRSRKSGCVLM